METLDNPELNISDMIASHAALYGKSIAIIDEQKSVTWADFNRNINKIANLLIKNGIKKGERIAVTHNNSIEMLEICFGIVRAGGCLVPISTMLTYKQIFNLLKDSSCSGLFCSDSVVKDLKEISYIRKRNFPRGLYAKSFKNNNWEKLEMAMNAADHRRPAVRLFGNDFFNIIYTSGTTGLPKGILQTHKTKLHFSFSNSIELGIKKESKTLTTTSLFSNGTWIIMLPTLFTGGTLLIMKEFDPEKFIKIVQIERVTHTFVVPTQLISKKR